MKIVKLQTLYSGYIDSFDRRVPELASLTYSEQKARLDFDGFGWADFWGTALRKRGHEVHEFASNFELLQKTWAKEQGVEYRSRNWLLDLARKQVLAHKPEVLFLADYVVFTRDWLKELRAECPSIKVIVGWCGAPFQDPTVFEAYDLVISDTPELIERFREMGCRAELLWHGFDRRILERIDAQRAPTLDFTFVGSLFRANEFHLERERTLRKVAERVPTQLFSAHAEPDLSEDFRFLLRTGAFASAQILRGLGLSEATVSSLPKLGKYARKASRPIYPVDRFLRKRMRPPVFGLEMFQVLHDSRATFNCHIDVSPRTANNLRLYEATGAGACLVTDWKENLATLFAPDREVVTYRSAEECVEKVRWLLENPKERDAIARAGQARTLRDHTWDNRAELLEALIQKLL